MLKKENYNREEILKKFHYINTFEYSLLPYDVQIAYCETLFGKAVEEAKETGSAIVPGYAEECYKEYFRINGSSFLNREIDETDYVQIFRESLDRSIFFLGFDRLEKYLNHLGNIKLDVFESCSQRYSNLNPKFILSQILYERLEDMDIQLTEEEINSIIAAETSLVASEDIEKRGKELSLYYRNFFETQR